MSKKVRALKRFHATTADGNESRWFNRGEVVPERFLARVNRPGFVDKPITKDDGEEVEVPEFADFADKKNVADILAWVDQADDYDERVARARHALEAEKAGQNRPTLLEALPEFIVDDSGEG